MVKMGFFHLTILAVIQGLTEFLPISSSGHLILISKFFPVENNLQFDISVHLGTLIAVIIYFKNDIKSFSFGLRDSLNLKFQTTNSKFLRYILYATIPVIFFGFLVKYTGLINDLRSAFIIGLSSIIFGILLLISDKFGKNDKDVLDLNFKDSIIIGFGQSISLIPGSSRSGTTITFARFLGYNRVNSSKISMIMSIPTILASGILLINDLIFLNYNFLNISMLIYSSLLSFVVAYLCLISFFFYIKKNDFTIFVIYRCILGFLILTVTFL